MIITMDMEQLRQRMKTHAHTGIFTGRLEEINTPYFCRATQYHAPTGTVIVFTRDVDRNKRCYHLSLSFRDPENFGKKLLFDESKAEAWVRLFYGQYISFVWEEGESLNREAKEALLPDDIGDYVHHFRFFCDPKWHPILPRKEVYSTDYTPAGWKSWSDRIYSETLRIIKR